MCFLARCQCIFQCDHQDYNWKTGSVWHSERTCFSIPFLFAALDCSAQVGYKKTFIQHKLEPLWHSFLKSFKHMKLC
jgi:hypothetical protein